MILIHFTVRLLQMVGASKGKVDVSSMRAVEFVDDNAFGLPHTFQVSNFVLPNHKA